MFLMLTWVVLAVTVVSMSCLDSLPSNQIWENKMRLVEDSNVEEEQEEQEEEEEEQEQEAEQED